MEIVEFVERARQSILEQLATPSKLGLVSPDRACAHHDVAYEEYVVAVEHIRAHLYALATAAEYTKDQPAKEAIKTLTRIGAAGERELLTAFKGKNLLKGAYFACAMITCAYFRTQSVMGYVDPTSLRNAIIELAESLPDTRETNGAFVRETYGVEGALGSAREGYKYVWEVALPIYRGFLAKGLSKTETNQRVLLRIIAGLDDSCVYHRAPSLAADVKTIADYLCNHFEEENLSAALAYFDRCSISTGGAGDILIVTILLAKLFPIR